MNEMNGREVKVHGDGEEDDAEDVGKMDDDDRQGDKPGFMFPGAGVDEKQQEYLDHLF